MHATSNMWTNAIFVLYDVASRARKKTHTNKR